MFSHRAREEGMAVIVKKSAAVNFMLGVQGKLNKQRNQQQVYQCRSFTATLDDIMESITRLRRLQRDLVDSPAPPL